jgi:hypothetical protein
VLDAMKREYTAEQYRHIVAYLSANVKGRAQSRTHARARQAAQ